MTPDFLSDPDRLGRPPAPEGADGPGPSEAEVAGRLGLSVADPNRPRPAPRPIRPSGPLVRLKGPRRTIRDTPQEQAERRPLLETLLVGWTGSIVSHALLVLLLLVLVLVVPKEKPRMAFDTELGSSLGAEDGLDLLGGFDDDLTEPIELNAPAVEPLLAELQPPGLEPDADRLRPDASRPESDPSDGGLGGGEFGIARFGEGLETIQGVEVRVGDPQFTLIWDSAADIDLHVIEPGGAHIYWAQRQGKKGGELDVDDTDGFGPENIYWLDPDAAPGEKVKGQGPPGVYHWYVHYYGPPGGFAGRAVPTRWKVRIKHAGQVSVFEDTLRRVNQRSEARSFTVGPAGDAP